MGESVKSLVERVAREAEAAEATSDPDAPLPPRVKVSRGFDRSRVLQIRLSEAEYEAVEEQAQSHHVPASTYARAVLLGEIAS